MRPRITLELKPSHVLDEGYDAHLIVGDEIIWIDRVLPDAIAADDFHSQLAKQFSKCGIDLVEDLQ